MNPLVSIIIPVYNGSNYMREAIDSALNQTYKNCEILVINDGSNDDGKTRDIALSYGERVRYFEKHNGGVSSALNMGIKKMQGDYFSWLSHDDLYLPKKIEMQIEAINDSYPNEAVAVYSNYSLLRMEDNRIISDKSKPEFFEKSILETGWFAVLFGMIHGCSLLIPKKYFETHGLFDESKLGVQDYLKWFDFFSGTRLLYVPQKLVIGRIHSEQVTFRYDGFAKENDEMFLSFLKQLLSLDLYSLRLDEYRVLGAIMIRMEYMQMRKAYEYCVERLKILQESENGEEERRRFQESVKERTDKGIYLYCAGRKGRALCHAFYLRGIEVTAFSDTDNRFWGRTIDGVNCVSPKEIPKDAFVIVTKEFPQELKHFLIEKYQLRNVSIYEEFMSDLMYAPIMKERI